MRHTALIFFIFGLMVCGLTRLRVYAQAVGSIVGTVSDPGGAIIPSATVTAQRHSNRGRPSLCSDWAAGTCLEREGCNFDICRI